MILFLSKLIPVFLFPLGLACALAFAACVAALRGRRRTSAWCGGLAFAVLYLGSTSLVPHALLRGLESRFPQLPTYPKSPAIVILGGSGVPALPPRLHPEINAWGDRLLYGALLYRQGLAPRIVVTGGKIPFLKDFAGSEAATNARILVEFFGVDSTSLILAQESRNTREDALWVRKRFEETGMPKEIILVTSAAHMPRSCALFRKEGFAVHAAPTDFHADAGWSFNLFDWFPAESNLNETWFALHEYFGYAAYEALGWI